MSELRADSLSPIDVATLWPQLPRLNTEVIATRGGENLLITSGLAATGLTRLPRIPKLPRTAVLGVKRGLGYRGVLVARELSGGAGWEVLGLRLSRPKDDDVVVALLNGTCQEVARRGGRTMYLRYAEGSPHAAALRRAGMFAYRLERLYAMPPPAEPVSTHFRGATRADRHGIFRLYCRAVPENVRRHEAPTQQDWRAVLDSFDCDRGYVLEANGALVAWVGIGAREAHVLVDGGHEGVVEAALDLVEAQSGRHGSLVIAEHQGGVEHNAIARGYTALGVRLMCGRRLAVFNSLKEVAAVPVDPMAVPQ